MAASGMDRRPCPLRPVQGALGSGEGRGRAWASPWPVRPCLPLSTLSQERPSACLRPLWGGGRRRASLSPEQGLARTRAPAMALHGAQGRPLWWACRVGVWALCPHRSAPPEPSPGPLPRGPPLLCGPCPVSTGPGLRAARWRGLISSWPAGSGQPREQRVDCASFWACSPPGRCPRGAPGVMLAFVAKRESSSQAARAQRTDGLGYQPRAQEPRSRQPVLDPSGLPPSPHQLPEAPRWQPGSSMPAPRRLLCRHLPSPAHSMCLSSPSPAQHPLAL